MKYIYDLSTKKYHNYVFVICVSYFTKMMQIQGGSNMTVTICV